MTAMATMATAAMVTSSAAMAAAAAVGMAAAAAVAPVAAVTNKLHIRLSCAFAFLVEHIKRRQGDVRNLLFTESDVVAVPGARHRYTRCRSAGNRRCAACERKRQPGDSQCW